MKKALLIYILLFTFQSHAQTLRGKITDLQGNPVEYASIYISETKTGGITSETGEFVFSLKEGYYTITIQHLSHKTITKKIQIPQDSPLEIKMETKTIILTEVKVSAKDEDKAYGIIRKTVAKSPYYQKQLLKYKATFYAKGTMKVKDIPKLANKLLEKEGVPIKKGDVYTEESISEISVTPNKTEQKVISKRSSFPKMIDMGSMQLDVYSSIYKNYGDIISPVTKEGLSVYRYRLEYSYRDNEQLIHHIKVIPRNSGNPSAFSGYIDIIDGSWHVYNFDLTVFMDLGVAKVGLNFKENFLPIEKNVYMPVSRYEVIDAKAMGFHLVINASYSIRYKDYEVNPIMYSSNLAAEVLLPIETSQTQPVISKKSEKLSKEITGIMEKEKLTTRDAIKLVDLVESKNKEDLKNNPKNDTINSLEIQRRYFVTEDSTALNYDSSFWEDYRTIPLSEDELKGFKQKIINDSVQEAKKLEKLKKQTRNKKDTTFLEKKGISMGVKWRKSTLAFNTVDGFKIGINVYLNKIFKEKRTSLNNEINFGYAIAQKHFYLYGSSQWNYNRKRFAVLEVFGGKQNCDFKEDEHNEKYLFNTISSLFFRDNLIRYYDRTFAGVKHKIEIFNGFISTVGLGYEQEHFLDNRSDYSFFFRKKREYQPNIPENIYVMENTHHISNNDIIYMDLSISYTPRMFFRYSKDKKIKRYAGSKYPTFTLSWRNGVMRGELFEYLELNIAQDIDLKLFNTFKYNISAGIFPQMQNNIIHFSQFKHFKTNYYVSFQPLFGVFNTMPAYQYSTNEWFASGHVQYERLYLLLKFIPGLNKTLITENLHLSFLSNPLTKSYVEVGYSLSKIYLIGTVGVFVGFDEFKSVNWSVRAVFSVL